MYYYCKLLFLYKIGYRFKYILTVLNICLILDLCSRLLLCSFPRLFTMSLYIFLSFRYTLDIRDLSRGGVSFTWHHFEYFLLHPFICQEHMHWFLFLCLYLLLYYYIFVKVVNPTGHHKQAVILVTKFMSKLYLV